MRAKFINEEDIEVKKVHISKKANAKGYYPFDSGHSRVRYPDKHAFAVLTLLKIPYTLTGPYRPLTDTINNYLERAEGFHYGVSQGFIEGNTAIGVTVEHAIPLAVEIKMMIEKVKSEEIKTAEDVIQFSRDHYSICLITKEENKRLNDNKLTYHMPKNWKEWIERYKLADINLVQLPGNK